MLRILTSTLVSALLLAQTPHEGTKAADAKPAAQGTQQVSEKTGKQSAPATSQAQEKGATGGGTKATADTGEKAVPLRSVGKASVQRIPLFWIILPGEKR